MWTLNNVYQFSEVCAAVAVVFSLLFVGYQVRQNSRSQTQATTQYIIGEYNAMLRSMANDADMASIYVRGMQSFSDLSVLDRARFSAFVLGNMRVWEDMYFRVSEGAMDRRIWAGFESALLEIGYMPGYQDWFSRRRSWFSEEFQEYVDSLLERPSPRRGYGLLDQTEEGR